MGKVKSGAGSPESGARKPPAKPKQRRKRQIDAEHETGSPSGVDKRHALLTAISRSVHEAVRLSSLLIFSRSTTAKVAELLPASSISHSELMFDSPLSDFLSSNFSAAEAVIFILLAPMSFDEDGFERKSD